MAEMSDRKIKAMLDKAAAQDPIMSWPADSVDPGELEAQLLDKTLKLSLRYRAMSSLQLLVKFGLLQRQYLFDILMTVLVDQTDSELLRHDVLFTVGQLEGQRELVDTLEQVLYNDTSAVIRHEAAETLGSIRQGPPSVLTRIEEILEVFLHDPQGHIIVVETCEVGLDKIRLHKQMRART